MQQARGLGVVQPGQLRDDADAALHQLAVLPTMKVYPDLLRLGSGAQYLMFAYRATERLIFEISSTPFSGKRLDHRIMHQRTHALDLLRRTVGPRSIREQCNR